MSLNSVTINLVTEEDLLRSSIQSLADLPFGPCSISPDALRGLTLGLKSHSTGNHPKEVVNALLGELRRKRWHITDAVQLMGNNTAIVSTFSISELRKIEAEAGSQGLSFIGILHSHPQLELQTALKPSASDKLCYLVLLEEFKRPVFFFIINPQTFELGWISISFDSFLSFQESLKFETHSLQRSIRDVS